jgi:hypothetical protein
LSASTLESLDANLLRANDCLFGGGTAIVLTHGEYRESADIDFIVSSLAGYRALRELVTQRDGLQSLASANATLVQAREVRADQYGLRSRVRIDDDEIKFEILHEGRIALGVPGEGDQVLGVSTLTPLDMATTKLLANSDRWADDAVNSRDLIDLAMMQSSRKLLDEALKKAAAAYGASIKRDLKSAIQRLRERTGRLQECMTSLQMTVPSALLWKRIRALQ